MGQGFMQQSHNCHILKPFTKLHCTPDSEANTCIKLTMRANSNLRCVEKQTYSPQSFVNRTQFNKKLVKMMKKSTFKGHIHTYSV